jgi:hypothetical protein
MVIVSARIASGLIGLIAASLPLLAAVRYRSNVAVVARAMDIARRISPNTLSHNNIRHSDEWSRDGWMGGAKATPVETVTLTIAAPAHAVLLWFKRSA